jgi:hypothetical protein
VCVCECCVCCVYVCVRESVCRENAFNSNHPQERQEGEGALHTYIYTCIHKHRHTLTHARTLTQQLVQFLHGEVQTGGVALELIVQAVQLHCVLLELGADAFRRACVCVYECAGVHGCVSACESACECM